MTAEISAPNGASSPAPASAIAAVDGFARQLYRRARTAGPEFAEIATEVRGLHTVLKHLRVEAEDPDSLLSQSGTSAESVYARQLTLVVENCDFALKQLNTILEKYGGSVGENAEEGGLASHGMPVAEPKKLESRERHMIALIQSKLATLKTDIDIFLDTVQLHNPAKARLVLDSASGQQLDAIKDKVDAIAFRLFRRRGSGGSETEEDLWQQFRNELEAEGFSSEVLRKNKEVLRAYIRELDSHGFLESDSPPSVRGLLDQRPVNERSPPPMTLTPASYPGPQAGGHLAELSPTPYNPYVPQSQQLQPHQSRSYQPPAFYPHGSSGLSYERYTSSSDDESDSDLALISTRDLMALDRQESERLAARMASMHLSPQQLPPPQSYSFSPGTSPNSRYLPAAPQPIPIAGAANAATLPLPPEHQLSSSPASQQLLGLSPRYVPPILVPGYGGPAGPGLSPTSPIITPPSAYGTSPTLALPSSGPPAVGGSALTAAVGQLHRQYSRLAPDSTGKDIPLDATWTKIRRALVSLEVLDQAGVRYEARPEFVAVLGHLSREQVTEFARQSEVVRRSRRGGAANGTGERGDRERGERDRGGRRQYPVRHPHGGKDRDASRENGHDRSHDRERRKHRGARGSGDESDVLWDESDTSNSDPEHPRRRRGGSTEKSRARDRYTPRTYVDDKSGSSIDRDSDERGTRVYPVIVNPPSMSSANGEGKTSPSSTSMPKPILKNRNENHVRFDDDGPREISQDELRKEREREKRRRERDRDRDRDRPKDHDRDRDRDNHGNRRHHGHRERDRDKDKDGRREERAIKKRVWGETLGAVGIGGAAASLLSVLTEAAGGF